MNTKYVVDSFLLCFYHKKKMTMTIEQRISAFAQLGSMLTTNEIITQAIDVATHRNPWFTRQNIEYSISAIASTLNCNALAEWMQQYQFADNQNPKTVAIIMAGNIPLVGFHDFLCVLMSGNKAMCKLSSNDNVLLPAVAKVLISIEKEFDDMIVFCENKMDNFDAVIATGSNNTSRYFEYYFGKYPNIIRHNRNSIAILNGNETAKDLENLCDDIFLHFGLGCRSVNKLYIPIGYNFQNLIEAAQKYAYLFDHHIYHSNFDYHKALLMLNNVSFVDGGFFAMKEDKLMYSPVSIINYEYYQNINEIVEYININSDNIQCVVSANKPDGINTIAFGKAQSPQLTDYADSVDTMEWLKGLNGI